MAERRMFAKSVVESDMFCDLPPMSQLAYFHLLMHADDDGFVDCQRRVRLVIGAKPDDVQVLIDKGYLIPFPDGVLCITHWELQNKVKGDRYKATIYKDYKALLSAKNKVYVVGDGMGSRWNQNGATSEPQVRRGEYRLDKSRVDKGREEHIRNIARDFGFSPDALSKSVDWILYKELQKGEQAGITVRKLLGTIKRHIDKHGEDAVAEVIDYSLLNGYTSLYFERLDKPKDNKGKPVQTADIDYGNPEDFYYR